MSRQSHNALLTPTSYGYSNHPAPALPQEKHPRPQSLSASGYTSSDMGQNVLPTSRNQRKNSKTIMHKAHNREFKTSTPQPDLEMNFPTPSRSDWRSSTRTKGTGINEYETGEDDLERISDISQVGGGQSEDELSDEYEQSDVKESEGGTVADVALWTPHLERGRQSSHKDLPKLRPLKTASSPQTTHEPNLESLSNFFAAANLSDIGDSTGNRTDESDSISNSDILSEISSLQVSEHERNPTGVLTQQVYSFYATAKSAVVGTLIKELYAMLNPEFGAQSCAGHTTENSRDQATNSNSSKQTKTPSRKNDSGKRPARRDNENEQGDEGDDDGSNKRRKLDDGPDEPDDTLFNFPGRRFACPFFQRNPTEHKGRACRYPGFTGIHRLK